MRILFVTEDLASGGSERVISVLANTMSKDCSTAVVAVRQDKRVYKLNENVKYYAFKDTEANKFRRTVRRIDLIKHAIKDFKPDVVIAFDVVPIIYSSLVCKLSKTKLIVSERANPMKHKEKGILGKLYFFAFEKANGAVFQTEDAKKYFSTKTQNISTVIPNPINEDFVKDRYEGERTKEIVTVCRLTKQKNIKLFIDIVKEIVEFSPGYKGIIYGDGPEMETLKQYAERSNIKDNIRFMGHVDNVADQILRSQFYLCTSDYEGISNSMLEAMTLGLTVISTDCPVGGARMAITSGSNGYLFPVGDKEQAVSIIKELVVSSKLADKVGMEATKIKDKWSSEKITNTWKNYIYQIIKH